MAKIDKDLEALKSQLKESGSQLLVSEEAKMAWDNMNPYLKISNKPKNKPTGDAIMPWSDQEPTNFSTESGGQFVHHPAKGGMGAWAEVSNAVTAKFDQSASLTKSAMVTVVEVVDALYAQGWRAFKIEAGSSHMQLACWSYVSTKKDVKISGFKPTQAHQEWHARVEEEWSEVKRDLDASVVDVSAKLDS